ncbi:hypothetical protein, partial [Conchiformibius kuhniae]|uniref:hypothetical protein n=1 Tax=Conchiformibius kuhniae TaxID=211502 RepID=UPI001B7F7B28
ADCRKTRPIIRACRQLTGKLQRRHSRTGGNQSRSTTNLDKTSFASLAQWIPAFAGITAFFIAPNI